MNGIPLLSLIVWLPTLGALLLLLPMSGQAAKRFAFVWSLLVFVLSLPLIPGIGSYDAANPGLQLQERLSWIPSFGIDYALGVDGISVWLVLLTTFLTPITILSTWDSINTHPKAFEAFMLLL